MPSLDKRLTKLEDVFMQHLTESGEIRGDLKWLKRSVWTLVGLFITVAGFTIEEVIRHSWS